MSPMRWIRRALWRRKHPGQWVDWEAVATYREWKRGRSGLGW